MGERNICDNQEEMRFPKIAQTVENGERLCLIPFWVIVIGLIPIIIVVYNEIPLHHNSNDDKLIIYNFTQEVFRA